NEIKAGLEINYDDFDMSFGEDGLDPTDNYWIEWQQSPIRYGAYVTDQLVFKGMIANLGLRFDYNDPRCDWYTADRYSQYFSRQFKAQFETETPTEPAKGHLKISPRIGISHPITTNSKLYFNYNHTYNMPTADQMYQINTGRDATGIIDIGDPNLEQPRTISYELGYEHEIGTMFLISLAGYYKDVTDEIAEITYENYDASVSYMTYNNSHYADIRGFELSLEKRWGDWITGWFNYNYMVTTDGAFGREFFYQDPRKQMVEGLRDPVQEKPLAQPFARADLQIRSPADWGPEVRGHHPLDELAFNMVFDYRAGDYETWEPIGPYKAENNVQWKDSYNFDARISKNINISRYDLTLYLDIVNIFDRKVLSSLGFSNEADWRNYMNSLHLPIYSEDKYQNAGFTAGDDKVGDVRSGDKQYINMPDIDYLSWNEPRSVVFGLSFDF
ncbi:MAG: TonB-dependent receptor, partial [candidate division Zixibacteria bacterium]|nr:TonB-dependent receptor [candidate division Zixibacteria bacterium]